LLVLAGILLVGGVFRFYNVNWDEGTYHIHPDERHTTMVVTSIQWPTSLADYFDTSRSPLNPRNVDKVFFYGTLPLFLTKSVATVVDRTGYDEIHLVGRVLSGLFDLGTVLLLYFLARRLFDRRVGLIASLLLALTALNIQGSHYFAVDTFLSFSVMLTIWFTIDVAEGKGWFSFLGLGLSMGLTLRRLVAQGHDPGKTSMRAVLGVVLAAIVSLAVFRVAQPYAWAGPNYTRWDTVPDPWGEKLRVLEVIPEPVRGVVMPNPQWIADIVSAGAQQTGEADLPWGRQWTERTPWLYPLENMVLWGMGVPLGIAAWAGVVFLIIQLFRSWRRAKNSPAPEASDSKTAEAASALRLSSLVILPLTWVLLTFFWQGMQYVKSIRYFLPIYPYLVMFAAYLVVAAWDWAPSFRSIVSR
jgi:4-amino-4-deoxy-L-arabinose transferase-like glycosyltransferase